MIWLLVSFCLLQASPTQAPARDSKPAIATAVIRGRITDRESGQPIPGALIAIRTGRVGQSVTADGGGRYEFTGLSAGPYLVMASGGFERATHLTHVFGDPRPLESSLDLLNKTFTLNEGEVRDTVDIGLMRALAIDGRVIDTAGEPMMGVEVTAASTARGLGDRIETRTDDRGLFRLYGLPPGSYRVCATPREFRSYSSGLVLPGDTGGRLLTTCFPDAGSADDATPVEVGGTSTPVVEISVRTHAAFTVSGTIVDGAGIPVRDADATLLRPDRESGRFRARADRSGRFAIRDVPAGKYLLQAGKALSLGPPRKGEAILGYLPVTVEGGDLEGLTVSIGPGAVVGGHITFLGGPAPRSLKVPMKVQAVAESGMMMASWLSFSEARVAADHTFELADLFLPSRIGVYDLPDGWAVASIRYGGRDVRNVAVRFDTDRDPRTIDIQLTNQVGELSGTVLDDAGARVSIACVVAVSTDAARPLSLAAFTQGYADAGVYRIAALPAGSYAVAAVPPSGCVGLREKPGLFDQLNAQTVTIAVGERRTFDLRLSTVPVNR